MSADGALRLEAGANGTIHSIELGDGGADLAAAVVVSLIVELHREAVTEAATTMRAAVAALSNDSRQSFRRRVGDPPRRRLSRSLIRSPLYRYRGQAVPRRRISVLFHPILSAPLLTRPTQHRSPVTRATSGSPSVAMSTR